MSMIFVLALTAAAPEVPASTVQVVEEDSVYVMRNLIDNTPLYTFDMDEPAKSNCNAECAAEWRPLLAADGEKPAGQWTRMKRDDGSQQWAYAGKPVYSFAREPEPVTIGAGKIGRWHLLPTLPAH